MLFNFIAAVLFIIGLLFLLIDFMSDAIRTKGFGMFCIILAAGTMLTKLYLANQLEVNSLLGF
jgi:hypothetical protein